MANPPNFSDRVRENFNRIRFLKNDPRTTIEALNLALDELLSEAPYDWWHQYFRDSVIKSLIMTKEAPEEERKLEEFIKKVDDDINEMKRKHAELIKEASEFIKQQDEKIKQTNERIKQQDERIKQTNERIKQQNKQHDELMKRSDEAMKLANEAINRSNEKSLKSIGKQVMNFSTLIADPAEIHEQIKSIKAELPEQKTINEELREMLNDLLKMIQHFFKNTDSIPMEEEKCEPRRLGFF
jgi:methyl-accepting chemotaxis protein